jgi:hypothetical protein
MISGGFFYKGHEAEAEALAATPDLGVSHGYEYGEKDLQADGSYRSYRTFEISPLPRHRAANNATLFLTELREENTMAFAKEKRDFLVGIHGEKAVKSMEDQLAAAATGMKGMGISFKDFTPEPDTTATNASAANAASASSVSLVDTAAGAKGTPADLTTLFAEAATVAVKEILQASLAPIADRLAAVETGMKEFGMADQERFAERSFRPRAADIMDRETPSNSNGNLISGNRGGPNRAAKDDGLEAVVREANRQINQKDDGVPANVPDDLRWYGSMVPGLFGAAQQEQPQ